MSRFRLLALSLLLAVAGCAAGADPNLAASVNGVDITIAEVEERLEVIRQNPQAVEQLANDPDGQILRQAENDVLNDLIIQSLLQQSAADELGVEVTDADVEAQREAVVEQIGGQEAFDQVIEQQGLSEEQVDTELRRLALNEAISAQFAEDADISDEDVEAFYEENAETRFLPTATARHILVTDEATAQSAIDRIAGGEDFAAVATELSTDTGSGAQGGDLGELRPGDTVPEFDEALFNSPVGEVVGPIQTEFGFHVLEVLERDDEGPELADVEEEIRDELAATSTQTQVEEFISEQSANAEVTVNPRFGEWNAESGRVEAEPPLGDASEGAAPAGSEGAAPAGSEGAVPPADGASEGAAGAGEPAPAGSE